jgi:hypothetical protein
MSAVHEARIRQQAIGARLRAMLADIADAPPPAEFHDILRRADESPSRRRDGRQEGAPEQATAGVQPSAPAELKPADLDTVCRLAHELNRAWCELNGDISQQPWSEAPLWQQEATTQAVRFFLEHPEAGDEAMHQQWLEEKYREGWTYGPVKDAEFRRHPCLVPFEQLSAEQQFKDRMFRTIVAVCLGNA